MSTAMVPIDVILIVILIAAVFIGICVAGFITFSRFLKLEKERGRRFRAIHGKQGPQDKGPKV